MDQTYIRDVSKHVILERFIVPASLLIFCMRGDQAVCRVVGGSGDGIGEPCPRQEAADPGPVARGVVLVAEVAECARGVAIDERGQA